MVPFHGQGMNCCFEDCLEFDACVRDSPQRLAGQAVFAEFGARRKPNTDAIAAMALENYLEMRERVARAQISAAAGLVPGTRTALSAAFHSALLHGDVPPRDSLSDSRSSAARMQSAILSELTAGSVDSAGRQSISSARNARMTAPLSRRVFRRRRDPR